MKKFVMLAILVLASCSKGPAEEPRIYVTLEEFNVLKDKVEETRDEAAKVVSLAGAFGRELLQFHLPGCVFVQREHDPLVFWVAGTCDELYDIKKDLKDARSITVRVYRSDNHTHWFWKFETVEY